jgi:hypothetical protein
LPDGKEGVSGSSPEEGSAKGPLIAVFALRSTLQSLLDGVGMDPVMDPSDRKLLSTYGNRWALVDRTALEAAVDGGSWSASNALAPMSAPSM